MKGEISRGEKLFMDYASDEVHIVRISIKEDGLALFKSKVFLGALVKVFWLLMREEIYLFRIHDSHLDSTFRQAILTLLALFFSKPTILQTHLETRTKNLKTN